MTGPEVLEEVESLLGLGFDVPDALEAVGRGYAATRRLASRYERPDLVERLSAWKKADAERLQRARGLAWA